MLAGVQVRLFGAGVWRIRSSWLLGGILVGIWIGLGLHWGVGYIGNILDTLVGMYSSI